MKKYGYLLLAGIGAAIVAPAFVSDDPKEIYATLMGAVGVLVYSIFCLFLVLTATMEDRKPINGEGKD